MKQHAMGLLIALLTGLTTPATHAQPQDSYGDQLGEVALDVSCKEPVQEQVHRALALLHHMTYEGARSTAMAITDTDPACSIGYWIEAMSLIHPLWSDPPSETEFAKGRALVNQARSQGPKSDLEDALVTTIDAYFAPGWRGDETINLERFEQAWDTLYQRYPEHPDVASFYALAHLATADPTDKSYAKQKRAGSIAEQILADYPRHPGAHHYLLHAYDYPPLAEQAVAVARSYGEIAPKVPHALHMPSHIFTRLGLWQEVITMNQRSAEAALLHPVGEQISLHYPHALDYQVYGYLQRGQEQQARQTQQTLEQQGGIFQPHVASAYALAAIPARIALERHQWAEAASLSPRQAKPYPWESFPAMEAITHFANALGAARDGDELAAADSLTTLVGLQKQSKMQSSYWGNQVEIQHISARAWLTFEQGDPQAALQLMQQAAEMERATEKHPVTPGEILPANELLGDMLLAQERYTDALHAYQVALDRSPNRLNSLYGAGRAAELAGNRELAGRYYRQLLEVTAETSQRPERQRAREFTSTMSAP